MLSLSLLVIQGRGKDRRRLTGNVEAA